jgi:ribosomal protein L40E
MAEKKTCPSCQAVLPGNAVLCVDCGYHLLSGKKLKTVSQRLTRVVGSNPATPWRIIGAVLLAVGGVGLIVFTVLVLIRDEDAPVWAFIGLGIGFILGGFGLGSGSRTVATRSRKGHPELWQQFWVFFIPASSRRYDLRKWDGVYFDFRAGDRNNPDIYIVQLGRNQRDEFVTLYHGSNEQMSKDLGDAIKEVSGLRLERK